MSKCKNCCKEFKYQWCLDRHLRRKIPCKENVSNDSSKPENDSSKLENDLSKPENDSPKPENDSSKSKNDSLICKYCCDGFSRTDYLKSHIKICKEKEDVVRCLEINLNINMKKTSYKHECRFCNKNYTQNSNLTRHIKTCKAKQEYRESLEAKLKEKTKHQPSTVTNNINNNQTTNNIGTVNVLNVSAETLRKFGEENTDHITNAYLRQMMGRLGVTIPKVVSNVAKKIYCDDSKPENQTIQITNVRSQWAKVSNGNDYELQALGDSVKGVRNKVTDLYVTRLCDDFEFFKKVTARIDRLDDLNNQNYTARTLEDKEDQKNASKLKGDIDREIKSSIYNVQKAGNIIKLQNSS